MSWQRGYLPDEGGFAHFRPADIDQIESDVEVVRAEDEWQLLVDLPKLKLAVRNGAQQELWVAWDDER